MKHLNFNFKSIVQSKARWLLTLIAILTLGVGQMWAATNYTKGEVIFIYADKNSAWDASACVKAWFNSGSSNDDGAASTNWLFDKSVDGGTEKMFYCVVPKAYSSCQLQRFASNCSSWWNSNGDIAASSRTSGYNTFYSNGSGSSNCGWKGTYTMYLKGSTDSWASNLATFTFSSGTTFTASYEFTAAATSYEFKMQDSYGNWHGSNVEVTGLVVGATYRFTGTINLASGIGSLSMSKTQLTFAIATSATNGSVSPTSAFVGSSGVSFTATPNTGYHWSSWGTTSGLSATNANPTSLTATAAGTLTANFTVNTYTVTYKDKGGSDYSGSNGASLPGSYTYGTGIATLTAGTKSGYVFDGWFDNESCTGDPVTTISTTATGNKTFYAKFTQIGITLTAGTGGEVSKDNSNWYDEVTITGISFSTNYNIYARANDGYTFSSWSKGTNSGNTTIGNTSNASTTISVSSGAVTTATANFTANNYTVTLDNQSATTAGAANVTATYNAAMPSIAANKPAKTGYDFKGYFGSTGGSGTKYYNTDGTSAHVWDVADDQTLYAYWTVHNYSITYSPSSAPSGCTYTVKPTNANYNTTVSMTITPDAWHHVSVSVTKAGGGSVEVTQVGNVYTFTQPAANVTVTVTSTDLHTGIFLPNAHNDFSTSDNNYEFKKVYGSSPAVATISVDIDKEDYSSNSYQFGGFNLYQSSWGTKWWKNSSSADTKMTSHNCSSWGFNTSDGEYRTYVDLPISGTYTFTLADYGDNSKQNISVTYPDKSFIEGAFPEAWDEDAYTLTDNGTTETVTINITSTGDKEFRLVSHGKLWGTSTKFTKAANYSQTLTGKHMTESGGVMTLGVDLTGEYTFTYNKSTHVLTVTWPVYNQVRISAASPTDASNTGNYDLGAAVSNVRSVTRSLNAGTTYTFKVVSNSEWYGYTSGTFTRNSSTSSNSRTISTSGGDMTLTTDYAGSYTFKFNESTKALSVDFPAAYKITFGQGSVNGKDGSFSAVNLSNSSSAVSSNSTWVKSGHNVKITAPSAKSGYRFLGWYTNNSATGDAITTNANCTINVVKDTAVYACYAENLTAITITTDGHGTITTPSPNSSPYSLGVTTTQAINASANTGYHWNTWTKSGTADLGSTATTQSNTAKGDGTNGSTGTIIATFSPNTYTIRFNGRGNTSGSMSNQTSIAYDSETTITANAFVKTGYNFAGWATTPERAAAGTVDRTDGAAHGNLSSTNGATVDLYAVWTAKQSALTLNYQTSADGYASDGSISNTSGLKGTYGSAMTALTGTMPTALPGYAFMGFYDATGGSGTKYYNADGSSAHNWDKNTEDGTTLFAYYEKAEITELTHNASVAKADVAYLVVNPVLNVTPTDYTDICWTLHYKENDNEVATSGSSYYSVASTSNGSKPWEVRFTLNNMAVGSYYVKAVLKAKASAFSSVCSEGTELDTETGDFSIVGSSTVTIQYKNLSTGDVIASSGSVEIEAESSAGIKAPNIIGYTFNSWSLGAGVTNTCADGASCGTGKDSINISSPFDGVITAFYTKKRVIYFNNTLNWSGVTVYFYSGGYWNDANGTGSASGGTYQKCGEMTQIEGTNIWYYDAEAASVSSSYTYVAFTEVKQEGYTYFSYEEGSTPNKVIYRSDYKSTTLPMFVPIEQEGVSKNSDQAMYYNEGYWMNYPDNTGYTLKIYNGTSIGSALVKEKAFTFNADKKMPMSVIVDLEKGKTYGFKIYRADGGWYGNANTMSNGHSGDEGQTVWEFTTGTNNCGLTTTSAGDYTFTLNYGQDASSNYNYLVGVRYPESTGDYRVLYKDNTHTKWLASKVIPKNSEKDTISYFVRSAGSPQMKLQKCTATYAGGVTTVTWSDTVTNLISSLPSVISSNGDGVYYFCLNKNEETGKRELGDTKLYEGNFYIRVKGAGSTGWDSYRTADHIMPYSEYSFNQTIDPYSHYFTHFYRTKTDGGADLDPIDISFVVANDYSTNISDTIAQDGIGDSYVNESGNLSGRNANIRFMYNYKTNTATRRYLDGAQGPGSDDFLLLIPSNNTSIYNAQTEGSAYTQVKFGDNGNWIYEANVYVVPGTTYKLKSQFGTGGSIVTQYLKGKESGEGQYETLISGSGSRLKIRLLYDFKTNRVIAAYKPSGTIDADLTLNADIMFERVHQGNVTQITFGENKSISAIQNVYTTLKFEKDEINNLYLSRYERDLFYISFPYNVRVSDIIGFGEYGKHWIIEYYDGAARAEKGFWADSKSFWKFVTPEMASSFTLKAGTGYIVALDLDEMGLLSSVWANTATVELIFPGDITSISNQEVTYTMPSHQCNIGPRFEGGDDRRIKDSHWNVLGVPAYHNTTGTFANHTDQIGEEEQVWSSDGKPNYLYTWNMTDNSLSVTNASGYSYKAMHAYIVQYYGDVTFTTSTNAAPSVAARRNENAPRDVEFRLEIQQNETTVDQTFVKLSNEEGVSSEFVFGEDLSKEFNKNKANIYTMVSSTIEGDVTVTQVAGNTLPMTEQTTIVPVGVQIKSNGEYTFAMPEGTEGIGVTLIDNVANTRTNLGLTDYTVTLSQGTIDGRFMLEISPIQGTTTSFESISDEGLEISGARKVMIDGLLYIVKDGKVFDATGARVK